MRWFLIWLVRVIRLHHAAYLRRKAREIEAPYGQPIVIARLRAEMAREMRAKADMLERSTRG